MRRSLFRYFGCVGLCLICLDASAQVFGSGTTSSQTSSSSDWGKFYTNSAQKKSVSTEDSSLQNDKKQGTDGTSSLKKQDVVNPQDYVYKKKQQIDRPTLDGVKRGRTSVYPLISSPRETGEGFIYLFYSDFSIRQMMNGSVSCDVKFHILTTLDRRLNSLAVRLKWPHMGTPLTFIDVNPNQKYYMTYTLLGDGCYSLDKTPNIIINRCRVKGMTQEACANKVRWISKLK